MIIYDEAGNLIDSNSIDLSIGAIVNIERPKKDVPPVDDVIKFFYKPEELETVQVYIINPTLQALKEKQNVPTELDRLEAQITYTAMMTGTLLEV